MISSSYSKALKETYIILGNSEDDIISKIPKSFMNFITDNMDISHEFILNKNSNLNNQPILNETKSIIALIFRSYLATPEELNYLTTLAKDNKIAYKNYDELFSRKKINKVETADQNNPTTQNSTIPSNTDLIPYKEANFFTKLFNKLKNILKKNTKQ